jgi:hypothetical protein
MFIEIWRAIVDGLTYDLFKLALGSLIMATILAFIAKLLKRFENVFDIIKFSVACFIGVFVLLFLVAPRTQGPQLAGGIQTVAAGGVNNDHDTIVVITMNVLNSGSMQSIVKNWNISAGINGRTYVGSLMVPAPKDFTFKNPHSDPNAAVGITYHGDDSLVDKSLIPIPTGGQAAGTLFVLFRDVEPSAFKPGADYIVSYEDVLSRQYSVKIASSAKMSPMVMAVGIHADLVCPAPPPGAPVSLPFTSKEVPPKLN